MTNLIQIEKYNFKQGELTQDFIDSLCKNDLFSFHCRDFVKFLGFKRCDKKFRESFWNWLDENNLEYVITNRLLTADILDNFFNAERNIRARLDEPCYPWGKQTWRQFYEWLNSSESGCEPKTLEEHIQSSIERHKKLYSIEIKEDKQRLSGAFNSGCWLILWKH